VRLLHATVGTYRPQYRPLPAICYLDTNPLPTRYTLFITLVPTDLFIDEMPQYASFISSGYFYF
jgi:hypothetical protein